MICPHCGEKLRTKSLVLNPKHIDGYICPSCNYDSLRDPLRPVLVITPVNVEWDTGGDECDLLPTQVGIPDYIDPADIADYLKDEYGYRVKSFTM